jgi:hypothetical protein
MDSVELMQRDGVVQKQIAQRIALATEVEGAGEEHDARGVRTRDGRHDLLHEKLMAGEPLDDRAQESEVPFREAMRQ